MNKLKEEIKPILAELDKYENQDMMAWANSFAQTMIELAANCETYYRKQLGVSLSFLFVLLRNGGRMTQKQFVQEHYASKQSISITLKNLEKRGLIERKINIKDHRKRWVQMTENGLNLIQQNLSARKKLIVDINTNFFDEGERRSIIATLNRLNTFYKMEMRNLKNK